MSYENSNEHENGESMNHSSSGDLNSRSANHRRTPAAVDSPSPNAATSGAGQHQCSYCGTSFNRAETKHMPFCSQRCQRIDLGMWLNEAYGLPHESESSLDSYGIAEDDDE